jgi:putative transposase
VRWQRPIEGDRKTVRIVCKAGKGYACWVGEVGEGVPLPETGRVIGLDGGISALLTTSDGDQVENPNYSRAAPAQLRRVQRSLARKQKGSQHRRKALRTVPRQPMHPANPRGDLLPKWSSTLVQTCDGIALEDLTIRKLVGNRHLSTSILDRGWGRFKQSLTDTAASAGGEIRLINPAYPSKCCSTCDVVFQDFDLSTRSVECGCGLSLDREHNAAINILRKAGWDTPVVANVECALASKGHWLMRRTRSLRL